MRRNDVARELANGLIDGQTVTHDMVHEAIDRIDSGATDSAWRDYRAPRRWSRR
jgi:hypothetical protein